MGLKDLSWQEKIQSPVNSDRVFSIVGNGTAETKVIKAAPGVDRRIFVTDIFLKSKTAVAVVDLNDGTSKYIEEINLAIDEKFSIHFETPLQTGDNLKLDLTTVGALGQVFFRIGGYTS